MSENNEIYVLSGRSSPTRDVLKGLLESIGKRVNLLDEEAKLLDLMNSSGTSDSGLNCVVVDNRASIFSVEALAKSLRTSLKYEAPVIVLLEKLDAATVRTLVAAGVDGILSGEPSKEFFAETIQKARGRREVKAVQDLLKANNLY